MIGEIRSQPEAICLVGGSEEGPLSSQPAPNLALEPTAYSVRCAPASGGSSPRALGRSLKSKSRRQQSGQVFASEHGWSQIMQRKVIRWLNQIGLDGIVIILLSLVGIALSIYSFIGGSQISQPLLVGVLSLLVIEAVLRRVRLENMKEEIIASLKGVRVEVFSDDKEFSDTKYRLLLSARKSVFDTELCLPMLYPSSGDARTPETVSPYRKLLNERLEKGEITHRFVQVIYDCRHFESVLRELFRYYKYNAYIGYFIGAPEVIPALNIMIFDDKHFLIGGYYGPSVRGDDRNAYIQNELLGATLCQYYEYLWQSARILNENRAIKWDEVKQCGLKLGYTLEELNSTVTRIANEVGFSQVKVLQ